ncbi:P-loop containing nucleoside triphosphate hydrolase [Caulifigura coniformis]|uniref:P-loop containing nucleoside triphosphate hydrolase n=1 Tax=Caulifigura coniformis TaxID=2527983 RepID=A0A517SGM8_9PLAN|nr:ABC transporter ATP-binding protein [Caulifigura coniformis]QDT55285.1 P-loop containing nucleoside triphosphate hydrolase [Caulifigura coniformis]
MPAATPSIVPMQKSASPYLAAQALDKAYRKGQCAVPVLRGVDITVQKGEFLSIVGQSGSGKSTLLHLLGLLDVPDMGRVSLNGKRIDDLPASTRDELRNRVFGFVFQFYHLLPELTLLENVLSTLMIRHSVFEYWRMRGQFRDAACSMIEKVGLAHRLKHRPSELSGGEMQRAAIARALVGQPEVLLADEPTGNLDVQTGREIMSLLTKLNADEKLTIVMVTHDDAIARRAERIVNLREGRLQSLEDAA